MKLYVLVPCFNEIKTINKIINNLVKVKKVKKDIKIILIDDGSNDGTKELIYKNIKERIIDSSHYQTGFSFIQSGNNISTKGFFIWFSKILYFFK